ncbi:MAG: DUF3486 family protein [Alphaproteobacteria bacterium]|nr:DUF3486 family protein [Alphaproteobacteria bacterium]
MAQQSNIKRQLTDEHIAELNRRIGKGAHTIDDLFEWLTELGYEVSRSSVGRYSQSIRTIGERLRRSREVAGALVDKYGEAEPSRALQLNVELMHDVIMQMFDGEDGAPVVLTPEQAMFMSSALRNLANASKTDAEHVRKIEEAAEKKAREEAAARVKEVLKDKKSKGMSKEMENAIIDGILGRA